MLWCVSLVYHLQYDRATNKGIPDFNLIIVCCINQTRGDQIMKKYALPLLLILALSALLIIGGCSKNSPTEPTQDEQETELDKPYGGFDTSDELPAFGDPEMSVAYDDDEDADDPISLDPEFTSSVSADTVNAYFIRITWGLLEFDSTATEIINWNGSASITRGTLGVMKTIRFEGNDHIVLPRTDRKSVQWVSATKPHYDGIVLIIVDRDTLNVDGEFTFTTDQYSRTFTYEELDSLELVETVTPEGHEVSIQAYNKKVIPFGGGFLDGKWIRTRKHGGIFKGRWINNLGTRVGHLKGIWGMNRFSEKVFFGKYISLNGRFGGLIAGNWDYADDQENSGWFAGRWVNRSLTAIGTLKGHWKIREDNPRHGFFHGKWKRTR